MFKKTIVGMSVAFAVAIAASPVATAAGSDVSAWTNKNVVIENAMTRRELLSEGTPLTGPAGTEGGWTSSPAILGSDANYYNRAYWQIVPSGEGYLIQNATTKRELLSDGAPVTKPEGGWTAAPKVVGADSNYYGRAIWKITPSGEGFLIQNVMTKRYLLSDGAPLAAARGTEGGWLKSPKVVGADANYYNRAIWKIAAVGSTP